MFKNHLFFFNILQNRFNKNQKFDFFSLSLFWLILKEQKNGASRVDVYLQKLVDQFATQEKSCKHGVEPKPLKT